MSHEIFPDLHVIEVPLPGNPLKSVNSYVVTSGDRPLIIDTGMLMPECEQALRTGLDEIDVDLQSAEFFITHLHADHIGLVSRLAGGSSAVYFNRPDADMTDAFRADPSRAFGQLTEQARSFGFSLEQIEDALQRHPGFKYSPPAYPPFTILEDGDRLNVGRYGFIVVATPGHTPGHLCLYEPKLGLLISGDHILGDITPNITVWADDDDTLGDYLMSLDKVATLDIKLVLPGHRRLFTDCVGRIGELKRHHRLRLDEAMTVLRNRPKTVYEIASRMTWDIIAESWTEFPIVQKWFAVSEAASHLRHLVYRDLVVSDDLDGVLHYRTL